MALKQKIDSNRTGLRYQEETSIGVANPANSWFPLEPNSYSDFGPEVTKSPRAPIKADRQRLKGNTTGLDVTGGFNNDITQENLQDIFQGFFFADLRTKVELAVATVDGTAEEFEPAAGGDGYVVDDLLFAKGFDDSANNGLHVVTGVPAAAVVPVTSDLVTAATQSGTISKVGHEFATADIDVDATGTLPALTSTIFDFTTLGVIPGEDVFVGGDLTAQQFVTAANNGFKRVRSVATNRLELDKSTVTMVDETGTGLDIRIFLGRALKNESDTSLIVRRTYQLERELGAPDDAEPAEIQAEYLVGSVANEIVVNIVEEDLVKADLSFVAIDGETIDGPTALKAGARPAITKAEAFNTSSNMPIVRLAEVIAGDEAPTPLVAFITELTLTIANGATPAKAIGTLGAFEIIVGDFVVTGAITGYFQTVATQAAVRDNADITLDVKMVQNNGGISWDIPLTSLGDGRATVAKDEAITIPLNAEAAAGFAVDPNLDHTAFLVFFDYLPDLANPA